MNFRFYALRYWYPFFLIFTGCTIKPDKMPRIIQPISINETIVVTSSDPILRNQVCIALKSKTIFRKILCNQESLGQSPNRLHVEATIYHNSLDYPGNLGYSVITLGTLLFVTSSAELEYHFQWIIQGEVVHTFSLTSRGRVGMWTVLPFHMGFVGMHLGTLFNYRNTIGNLRIKCLNSVELTGKQCELYRQFQQGALAKISQEIWSPTKKNIQFQQGSSEQIIQDGVSSTPESSELICETCFKPGSLPQKKKWDLVLYTGKAAHQSFGAIIGGNKVDYFDSRISVMGLNYPLEPSIEKIHFEMEGQIGKHEGLMHHWESNLVLIARIGFLEESLPLSLAYGIGLSYAWEVPEPEAKIEGPPTNQILNYFLFELDVGLPGIDWNPRLLLRIHHRSGVYGIYCPDNCGANFVTAGIKISF